MCLNEMLRNKWGHPASFSNGGKWEVKATAGLTSLAQLSKASVHCGYAITRM